MSAPNPYDGLVEDFNISDWKEAVKNFRPSGPNSFSQTSGEAALSGFVPAWKIRAALRYFLGYNNISNKIFSGGTTQLQRTNPLTHPVYQNTVCVAAAETQFKPGQRNPTLPPVQTQFKIPKLNPAPGGGPSMPFFTGYQTAEVTLRFAPLPYPILEDAAIVPGQEYLRNTYVE